MNDICELLKEDLCTSLNEPCSKSNPKNCVWRHHYNWLQLVPGEPPINADLKQKIFPKALAKWKGGRNMTARPLEDSLKEVFDYHLRDLDVQINVRKQVKIIDGFNPIVGVLMKKDGYPTSFILAKTYLETGELRECFVNAYFTKVLLGSKNTRCFVVTIDRLRASIRELIKLSGSFFDGVYSLSGNPPVDDLVRILRALYDRATFKR
jgi:hypothetical protein